jgi:hypothetical protein
MLAILTAAAIPLVVAVPGVIAGIVKDGSPFKKDWWTS